MEKTSEIILSICIPTYNRAGFLKNSLESLYKQINDKNCKYVEVMVSNNCSTDNTHSLVEEYINKGLAVTYFKNKSNIGGEGNFLQCIHQAKGKYVLLLGDDDLLLEGSVDTLIQILSKDEYGLVYLSGRPYSERNTKGPNILDIDVTGQIYTDINDFLKREQFFITFISGNLFNKTLIPEFDTSIYVNSCLPQVPFFLYAACYAKKNLYLKEKFLATGGNSDNNGGYGLFSVFGINLFDILQSFKKKGISDETIQCIANGILVNFFPFFILVARKTGNFSSESIRILEKYHASNWRYRYIDYPLFSLPLPLAKSFYFIFRCFRKALRLTGLWKD